MKKALLLSLLLLASPACAVTIVIDPSQGTIQLFNDGTHRWTYSGTLDAQLNQGNPGVTEIDFAFSSPLIIPMTPGGLLPMTVVQIYSTIVGGGTLITQLQLNGGGGSFNWGSQGFMALDINTGWSTDTPITLISDTIQTLADGGPATMVAFTLMVDQDPFLPHPVPEPATWILMLAGFGLFAAWRRRHV